MADKTLPSENPWLRLKRHTPARIGLASAGAAVATHEHLAFQLAHARARDAVHEALDPAPLLQALREMGLPAAHLRSAAGDRRRYLLRPDLGRQLDAGSRAHVPSEPCDLMIVLADGLSARAAATHAVPLLHLVVPQLQKNDWRIAAAVVEQGRVAIGDEIAAGAAMVAVLIGERPGLSSPDSLGVYLTWAPHVGCKDSERNCVSNIRPEGLGYADAAAKVMYLLTEARRRHLTGVMLKDETIATARLAP